MKIAIIGYSGSGKSTLAQTLGERHGVDVLYLDMVHWLPGWIERPREEELPLVEAFLDSHDGWIIDGNYRQLHYARRMEEADTILFLCFNRVACLLRCWKRYRDHRGKTRQSMTEGCPEKLDVEFVRWILFEGRNRKQKGKYRQVLAQYPNKTTVIRNQRALDAYLRNR